MSSSTSFSTTPLRERQQSYFASPFPGGSSIPPYHPHHHNTLQHPFPDTPPSTPPLSTKELVMSATSQLSLNLNIPGVHRHTYDCATPDSPTMPDHLPFIPERDEMGSPMTDYEIATPDLSPNIPALDLEAASGTGYRFESPKLGFPVLPPHHPLRKQLFSDRKSSPPTTPKGHPLTASLAASLPKKKSAAPTYTYATLAGFLLRVPRRARLLLFISGICLFAGAILLSLTSTTSIPAPPRYVQANAVRYDKRTQLRLMESVVPVHPPKVAASDVSFASKEDELLGLLSFIISSTGNTLPPLDPSVPLSPTAILGFEPSSQEDLATVKEEVNALYPIVLFGRMRDPWHREIQKMLAQYKITPSPVVVDVDQRVDHLLLTPLLERLLDTKSLPQLLLLGKPMGSYHDVLALRDAGMLQTILEDSGAVSVRTAKPKKKGRREEERMEMERLLAPKPIGA